MTDVDAVMADLRARFPEASYDLVPVQTRPALFVLRNPSHPEHTRFRKEAQSDDMKHVASENLFVATCVYPEREQVTPLLRRYPGLITNGKIQRALAYLSGAVDELEGKG
jgi:hypothetical protein